MDVEKLDCRPGNDADYKSDWEQGAQKNTELRGKK
jgi:hypothetical protein